MNLWNPICCVAACLLVGFSSDLSAQVNRTGILHDTLRNREARQEYRREREEWIAAMHRAAPGVNVSLVNSGIRRARRMLLDPKGRFTASADREVNLGGSLRGTWSERGSRNQAGRTHAAAVDWVGEKIYVAADGGQIWEGSLEGGGWRPLNDPVAFRGVRLLEAVRTDDGLRLIVVGGNYAWTTGSTVEEWVPAAGLESIARWGSFTRCVMTDGVQPTIYAVGEEWDYEGSWESIGALYRSTDLGTSFERVALFSGNQILDLSAPAGEEWAYILIGDTLGRIGPQGGVEVLNERIELDGGGQGVTGLNLRSAAGGILALMVDRRGEHEMQISGDEGESWSRTGPVPTGLFTRNSFAIDPENPARMIVGGVEVWVSEDAGFNWTMVNPWGAYYGNPASMLHADVPFIDYDYAPDGSRTLLISTDGGLYRSDNDLATVRNISLSGLGVSQYYSVYTSRVDTNVIFAGAQDQGFQRSIVDHGGVLDFVQTISGDYGHISSGDGGKSIWTNYPGFSMYYRSASEELLGPGEREDFPTTGHLWIPPLVVDPDTPSVAWVAGGSAPGYPGAHLIRMAYENGQGKIVPTIHPFDFTGGGGGSLTSIAISPVDHNRWYATTSDLGFWVSTDRGKTWVERNGWDLPGGHWFYGVALLPSKTDPGTIWVAGSGYSGPGVWVSHDNGLTFDSMSTGLPPTLVYDIDVSHDGSLLFAATEVGPWIYIADSARWYDAGGGAVPEQTWWSVDYIEENGVVRFGTYGRGIWDLRLQSVPPTGVDEAAPPSDPELQLGVRNSADRWELTVTTPVSGIGRLEVYDRSGRLAAVLHDGPISRGTTGIQWDGATAGGRLPSGRYFCLLLLGGSVAFTPIDLP